MNILDRRFNYIPADVTNVRATLKAHGHVPPEQRANEAEQESRIEGALRCMKRLQSETTPPSVTNIQTRRRANKGE